MVNIAQWPLMHCFLLLGLVHIYSINNVPMTAIITTSIIGTIVNVEIVRSLTNLLISPLSEYVCPNLVIKVVLVQFIVVPTSMFFVLE